MKGYENIEHIIAFLCILFGDDDYLWNIIMDKSPDYIIEKLERYILAEQEQDPMCFGLDMLEASIWGIHPVLRKRRFNAYAEKWKLGLNDD